nr:MAG TPA: stabilization protein [Bacteriophage sp.]
MINIPKIKFLGVELGGKLSVGNYHFYFTYVDSDGNETDIVGESGLVSLFIGQYPTSVRGGFRNENTHKRVRFQISNIDTAYQYM